MNKVTDGVTRYSYSTLGLLIVCIYAIIPLGKAYPNGCSMLSIVFFWILFVVSASLLLFVPGSIEGVAGSPAYIVQSMCGTEVDWIQCVEHSADSNPAIVVGILCFVGLASFIFVSFIFFTIVLLHVLFLAIWPR